MKTWQKGTIAEQWWQELAGPDHPQKRNAGRAVMARLRRAQTPTEALLEPATIDLARRLGVVSRQSPSEVGKAIDRVAILAALLAHVREQEATRVARACGPTASTEDDGKLKYGRFRRLLQAQDDELINQMRRLVHLLGRKVNVADLASSILSWDEGVRRQWALQYFGAEREADNVAAENPAGC